jgi:peptidoglycan/xylan/chitin deacetylase (PgdA/CDA1 family)
MTPLKWTVDPRDWARPGVKSILRTVYAELRPGGVILMHDGGGNRAESFAALQVLLRRLPKMGYHFVVPPAG